MPEVRFDTIATLFREKASDRVGVSPPSPDRRSAEFFASESFGAQGSQTPPQASSPQNVDAIRMRQSYGGHLGGDTRVGFVLTTDWWQQQGRALALHAGPASADWTLALRAQDEEIKAGHARYAQARTASFTTGTGTTSGGTFFDFPRVQFQFQAGNILPIKGFGNEVAIPYGLEDFYLFFELLNQPPIIPSGKKEGGHNYVWIFYTSLQLPSATLKGYFDPAGISWEDNTDEATVRWSAEFMVHEMSPALWERDELFSAYTDFMRANGTLAGVPNPNAKKQDAVTQFFSNGSNIPPTGGT